MMKILLSTVLSLAVVFGITGYQNNLINQKIAELQTQVELNVSEQGKLALGADGVELFGGQVYYLSGGGISSSAASLTLTSLTIPMNGYEIQDSELSDTFYLTIDPGSRTRQEFVSCTTVDQSASNDTATLSGCTRGLSPLTPYTASTSLMFPHGGGTKVIFSNPPQVYNQAAFKSNDESITGVWDFSSTSVPRYDFTPGAHMAGTYVSTTSEFATIDYVNQTGAGVTTNATESVKGVSELATALEQASSTILGSTGAGLAMQSRYATDTPLSGCASGFTSTAGAGCSVIATLAGKIKQTWFNLAESWTFTGGLVSTASSTFTATTTFTGNMIGTKIMASSTAGSTITGNTLPQPVSLSTSTSRINPADANDYMFFDNFYGFAVQSGASGASILVQTDGIVSGFSGLTAGATYYVQDAAGTIGTSVGTYEMKVGVAISGTEVKIERGQGEYLGSVAFTGSFANLTSCQMTATSTYMASKFISDLDGAGAGGGAPVTYSVTLPSARRGATTVNSSATLGSPSTNGNYTVALSGNVITATAGYSSGGSNGSCSGTLYMYR